MVDTNPPATETNGYSTETETEAEEQKRRIVAFVDYPCIDGLACAWALRQKYPKGGDVDLKIVGISHNDDWVKKIDRYTQEGDELVFADVSPKSGVLEEIGKPLVGETEKRRRFSSITIYDHHASEATIKDFKFRCKKGERKAHYPELHITCDPEKQAAALVVFEDLFGVDTKIPEILKWVGKLEPTGKLDGKEEYAIASYIDSKRINTSNSELKDGIEESLKDFEELTTISRKQMLEQGEPILSDQIKNIENMFANPMYALVSKNPKAGDIWIPIVEGDPSHYGRAFDYLAVELGKQGTGAGVAGAIATDPKSGRVILRLRSDGTTPNLDEVVPELLSTFNQMSVDDVKRAMDDPREKAKLNAFGGGHRNAAVISFRDLDTSTTLFRRFTRAQMQKMQWNAPTTREQETTPRFNALEILRG